MARCCSRAWHGSLCFPAALTSTSSYGGRSFPLSLPPAPGMPTAECRCHFLCKATLIHPVSWLRVSPEESNPTPIYRSLLMAAPTLGVRGWALRDWAGCKHRGSKMAETLAHFPAWELRRGCSRRQSLAQPGGGVGRRDGRPQATPPPIQVLMSSSRDLEAPRSTGGLGGWRPAWVPAHLVSRAQPQEGHSVPRGWAYSPQDSLSLQLAQTVYTPWPPYVLQAAA